MTWFNGTVVSAGDNHSALVIVLIVKFATPYIADWLTYHSLLGCSGVVVISNECNLTAHKALMHAVDHAVQPPPIWVITKFRCARHFQISAYQYAVYMMRTRLPWPDRVWAAFFDVDEYLVINERGPRPVNALLAAAAESQRAGGVQLIIDQVLFGTSERLTHVNGFVPLNYIMRAGCRHHQCNASTDKTHKEHAMHKSMCRLPNANFPDDWPHACAGRSWTGRDAIRRKPFHLDALVHINHYWTYSLEEYATKTNHSRADNGRKHNRYDAHVLGTFSDAVDLRLSDTIAEPQWRVLQRMDRFPAPVQHQVESRCRTNYSAACVLHGFPLPQSQQGRYGYLPTLVR